MKTLKSISAKTFALALILGLAAGCASVTDATFNQPSQPVVQPANPTPNTFGGGEDVQPILDKPL